MSGGRDFVGVAVCLHISYRLHEFVWHGTDRQNKTQKIPGALRFTKLRVIPDQFYYNVSHQYFTYVL